MNELYVMRRCARIAPRDAARRYQRHPKTVTRWERKTDIDPLVHDAYRYLTGQLHGWTGFCVVGAELQLPDGSRVHRNHILNYWELINGQRRVIELLEHKIKTLRDSSPQRLLVSFLRQGQPWPDPAYRLGPSRTTPVAATTTSEIPGFASRAASNSSKSAACTKIRGLSPLQLSRPEAD